jgi:hypothetical protein
MLSEIFKTKKANPRRKFQILFLRNDSSQEVEVHEVKNVDFFTVQERLEHGESVFITSKNAQKIKAPRLESNAPRSIKTKCATAFYLEGI